MKQVTIQNATSRTVTVPMNSGRNLFIAPRGTSPEVPESEVRPNARVEKLESRKAIIVKTRTPRPARPKRAAGGAKKTAKKS